MANEFDPAPEWRTQDSLEQSLSRDLEEAAALDESAKRVLSLWEQMKDGNDIGGQQALGAEAERITEKQNKIREKLEGYRAALSAETENLRLRRLKNTEAEQSLEEDERSPDETVADANDALNRAANTIVAPGLSASNQPRRRSQRNRYIVKDAMMFVIWGTLIAVAYQNDSKIGVVLLLVLGAGLCWFVDSVGGGTDSPTTMFFRLIARHVRLALKLTIGIILAVGGMLAVLKMNAEMSAADNAPANSGGPESEKLAGFVNRATAPLQWMVDGFLNLLGVIVLLILFGFESVAKYYAENPLPINLAFIIVYVIWLGFTVREIVADELLSEDKRDVIGWSLIMFAVWGMIVVSLGFYVAESASGRAVLTVHDGKYHGRQLLDCASGVVPLPDGIPPDGNYDVLQVDVGGNPTTEFGDSHLEFRPKDGGLPIICGTQD